MPFVLRVLDRVVAPSVWMGHIPHGCADSALCVHQGCVDAAQQMSLLKLMRFADTNGDVFELVYV